jgi:hypothetical protein
MAQAVAQQSSLLALLKRLGHAVDSWDDLRDGNALREELVRMGAAFDASSSVAASVALYYHSVLESHLPQLESLPVDLAVATEEQLTVIVQLILSAAVQSDSRELYISKIMMLPDSSQAELMAIVDALITSALPWPAAPEKIDPTAQLERSVLEEPSLDSSIASSTASPERSARALAHRLTAANAELEDLKRANTQLRAELETLRRITEAASAPHTAGAQSGDADGPSSAQRCALGDFVCFLSLVLRRPTHCAFPFCVRCVFAAAQRRLPCVL